MDGNVLSLMEMCSYTTWHACKSMNTLPEATLFDDHICDILKANDYWACVEVNPADDSLLCASKQEYILWNHGTVCIIG